MRKIEETASTPAWAVTATMAPSRGGRTAAVLASLTSTCCQHDIDPQLYLTQLLTNLPTLPIGQLPQWLPDQWKTRHTAHLETLQNPATQIA